mmetsp:Transcript_11057/g.19613  ORF Transcript_11057/g.19613 Transcript_11057/m.19613 type:complete len:87 (+) Transcript_11057:56-316(+)
MMRAAGKNFGVVRKAAQKRSFSQSPHDQPQHYDAPVPVTKNFIMAGVLAVFAGSVYYYTVKRIQINTELGAEFEEIFKDEKPAEKK